MDPKFPAGVVTTTDKLTRQLEGSGAVNVEDIAQLWKVYTTQSATIRDGVVSRLENLFWRIWGNHRLRRRLSGSTLATLFMAIDEDGSLRSTPRQSLSKSADTYQPNELTKLTILTISSEGDEFKAAVSASAPRKESKTPLPPILKKPNEGKNSQPSTAPSSYKTARIVLPDQPSQRQTKKPAPAPVTAATSKAAPNSGDVLQKQNRRKPTFVATTPASSRRRGVLMRRKSSQTSPLTSPTVELDDELLPALTNAGEEEDDESEEEESGSNGNSIFPKDPELSWQSLSYLKLANDTSTQPSRATSPSSPRPTSFLVSSVRRHRNPSETSQLSTGPSTQPSSYTNETLVDRDFRNHFVERRRQESVVGAASSLTTTLSSTHIRDLASAAETAIAETRRPTTSQQVKPEPEATKHETVANPTATPIPPETSRRKPTCPAHSRASLAHFRRNEVLPSASTSTTQSQQTTRGIISVPKKSQEQLISLMKKSK